MKLEELSFTVITGSVARNIEMQEKLFNAGLVWGNSRGKIVQYERETAFLKVKNGGIWREYNLDRMFPTELPEVTYQQALDLISQVKLPEKVFDIKPLELVIGCEGLSAKWKVHRFIRIDPTCEYPFIVDQTGFRLIAKYEGNEDVAMTYAPAKGGWWEFENGKPVWVKD